MVIFSICTCCVGRFRGEVRRTRDRRFPTCKIERPLPALGRYPTLSGHFLLGSFGTQRPYPLLNSTGSRHLYNVSRSHAAHFRHFKARLSGSTAPPRPCLHATTNGDELSEVDSRAIMNGSREGKTIRLVRTPRVNPLFRVNSQQLLIWRG